MKVYLCGPINGRSDDDCRGWREHAKDVLSRPHPFRGPHTTIDPMDRDYRGRELDPGIAAEIVENDKCDVQDCDVLLVFYDKPSVGTSMEILFAHGLGKRIVLIDKSGKPLSPWLLYHCKEIYQELDRALMELCA